LDNANNIQGWMTAQVFLKLSSKLAAEQGVVDGIDGTVDSGLGASSNAVDSDDAILHHARRASSAQKKLRGGSREKSKKTSYVSSTSSTM
jgi:hypothetical protein